MPDEPARSNSGCVCCSHAVGHQPASSSGDATGKMLPGLSFRKCDSPEHLVCFCLVDMLNLINDSVSLFILAPRKLGSNSILPYGVHSSLLISLLELVFSHLRILFRFPQVLRIVSYSISLSCLQSLVE